MLPAPDSLWLRGRALAFIGGSVVHWSPMQNTPIVLGFTAGELSPWLSTRFDLQAYQRGAALLENFFVQPYGGVRRRNGTTYVGAAAVNDADAIRLFPFHYSESDALLLEIYPRGMRVYRRGVLLMAASGSPYVLKLPWKTAAEISALRLMQVNDAVYATCPGHPPVGIWRYGDTDWKCAELELDPFPRETYVDQADGLQVQMSADATTATLTLDVTHPAFTGEMAGKEYILADADIPERTLFQNQSFDTQAQALPSLETDVVLFRNNYYVRDSATGWYQFYYCRKGHDSRDFNGSLSPADYPASFSPGVMRLDDNGAPYEVCGDWEIHTNGEWNALWELWRSYDTTAVNSDCRYWNWTRIRTFGQDAYSERKNWSISGSEERPCRMVLVCRAASSLTVPACVYFRILGGRREYKLKITSVTSSLQAEAEVQSSYLDGAKCFYTYRWSFGAFGQRNGYPRFSGLHQGRLWFGGTPGQATTLFASATDDFMNFRVGSNDADALHLTLASDDQSCICWICPARSLLVGTSASEWTLSSPDGGAVTSANASFTRQSSVGSESKDAHSVENAVFYVQRGGKRLREISYKLEADGFTSTDTSLLAEHLFASGVKEWAVQRGSSTHLWVLMQDGTLGVLTTNIEQQVTAWQRVTFPGRRVCHLAALMQEGSSEDELWLVIHNERGIGLSLERLVESSTYLDGTGMVQGYYSSARVPSHVRGLTGVVYPSEGPEYGVRTVFGTDGSFAVPEGSLVAERLKSGSALYYGLPFCSELQTMPLEREVSFNAVHQLGRVKLRLLDSDPSFEFRSSHAEQWEVYEPARDALSHPCSGAIRVSHIPAPGVGQGFCLRYSGTQDFRLLSLTVDMDFHGR